MRGRFRSDPSPRQSGVLVLRKPLRPHQICDEQFPYPLGKRSYRLQAPSRSFQPSPPCWAWREPPRQPEAASRKTGGPQTRHNRNQQTPLQSPTGFAQCLQGIAGLHAQQNDVRALHDVGIRGGCAHASCRREVPQTALRAARHRNIRSRAKLGAEHSLNQRRRHLSRAEKGVSHGREGRTRAMCSKEFRESAAGDSWKELPASKVWNTTLE